MVVLAGTTQTVLRGLVAATLPSVLISLLTGVGLDTWGRKVPARGLAVLVEELQVRV